MNIKSLSHTMPEVDAPLSERAYVALRQDILMGKIEPGSKLKMDDLQRSYGFSSSPLREALSRLVAEKIVTADERRGFRAAPISLADLHDITQFRLISEINAFGLSIANGTTEWEAGMVSALHRLKALEQVVCPEDRLSDVLGIAVHKSFHISLIAACGSGRLISACADMFDYSQRYKSLWVNRRPSPRNAAPEHKRLVDAALRRDSETACELLRQHIQKTTDHVSKFLA